MKQGKFLKGAALFISLYMLAALTWWTYSLLNYSKIQYHYEHQLLEKNIQLCSEDITNRFNIDSLSPNRNILYLNIGKNNSNLTIKKIINYVKTHYETIEIKSFYLKRPSLIIFSLHTKKDVIRKLELQLSTKNRTWLGEGITIGAITLIIICAMYFYLNRILRFNLQQTNFMMAVTHELKTPIAASKLAIQTLIRRKNIENQGRILEISKQNMDRLSGLIDRVLLATQFENSLPKVSKKWVYIEDIVKSGLADCVFSEDILLKINITTSQNFKINCDADMMKIALVNLFGNSIKYSDENSVFMNIQLFTRDNNYFITISDNGFGISVAERSLIFDKFYRIGNEATRSKQGSGLGLYLVKQILNVHQSEILITENKPKGSNFTIKFNPKDCLMN